MKAETANSLAKARRCLDRAKNIAALPEPEVAAREAYLAAYHAAEAYIFERTGKGVKTHRGLRATFSRLARNEPRIAPEYLTLLARTYEFKSIADYGVDPTLRPFPARMRRWLSTQPGALSTQLRNCCWPARLRRSDRNKGRVRPSNSSRPPITRLVTRP